jgi:proteasome lid subunit RPN8/RPN11
MIKNKSIIKIKDFIAQNSFDNMAQEICGFIGYDEESKMYLATIEKNESSDPKNYFIINPVNYLKFKNNYNIIGVFHSHIMGDETASEFDVKMSEMCCLPFIIFSTNTKKFNIYEPKNQEYDVKLLERVKAKLL